MSEIEMAYEGVAGHIRVPERRVENYQARGWTRVAPPSYEELTKPKLWDEIHRRNEDRDEESRIDVPASANKPDLIAALEADDGPPADQTDQT